MYKLIGLYLLGVSTCAAAFAQSTTPSPPVSDSVAQVLITISGKTSEPLVVPADITFTITDNKKQTSAFKLFPAKDQPIVFSLLLDASGSLRDTGNLQTDTAARTFGALSKGANHGYLIVFRDEVVTKDHYVGAPFAEQVLRQVQRMGSTALYDAIVHAAKNQLRPDKLPDGSRRVIVLFSDGGDNISHFSLERTISIVQREGIPIFVIEVPSAKTDKRNLANLRALTQGSGGRLIFLDDSGDSVTELLALLDAQYLLKFAPTPEKHGKLHSLVIKSNSPDLEISAPASYLAP